MFSFSSSYIHASLSSNMKHEHLILWKVESVEILVDKDFTNTDSITLAASEAATYSASVSHTKLPKTRDLTSS
jgi:hypothetical protein